MEHQQIKQIKQIYRDYVICLDPLGNPFGISVAVWAPSRCHDEIDLKFNIVGR